MEAPVLNVINGPFKRFFGNLDSWKNWLSFIKVIYGLPLDPDDLGLFQKCTGRSRPSPKGYHEIYCLSGRQSGKSTVSGAIAAAELVYGDWPEGSAVLVISPTLRQSQHVFSACARMLSLVPGAIKKQTSEEVLLRNDRRLQILPANFRTARGQSAFLVIVDELQSLDSEGARPASELFVSLTPSILPGGRILGLSTAGPSHGFLFDLFERFYSFDDEVLFWKSSTSLMNPNFSQRKIDKAILKDPERYRSEYLSEFRSDEGLLFPNPYTVTSSCTVQPSPPQPKVRYFGAVDMASDGHDFAAMAICHWEFSKVRLDYLRQFSASELTSDIETVVNQMADIFQSYRVGKIKADKHSRAFVDLLFRKKDISVDFEDVPPATDLFLALSNHLRAGDLVLLSDKILIDELQHLVRRNLPSGGVRISHPAHKFDDLAVAASLCIWQAFSSTSERKPIEPIRVRHPHPDPEREKELQAKDVFADCEREMMEYIAGGGGLGIPVKPGR
jgi:hypothetical protein